MSPTDIRLAETKIKAKHDAQIKSKQNQTALINTQSNFLTGKKTFNPSKNSTPLSNTSQNVIPLTISNQTLPVVNVSIETKTQHQKQQFTKLTQDQSTNKALTQFLGFLGTDQTK
jgi:hypothetical protein